jgi:hypothetical protein
MQTELLTVSTLKQILTELFLNKTNEVTKISDNSTLSGLMYANAKVAQKAIKDIALVESNLFPDYATGTALDNIAANFGISERQGALGSSTYVLLVATPGTLYTATTNIFNSQTGQQFELVEDATIGSEGYGYFLVRSIDTGLKSNVEPLSINSVVPEPMGHTYVINEYSAVGGRDVEEDDIFRKRIKENPNIVAQKTLAYLTNLFRETNENVLDLLYEGINNEGKVVLNVLTQNGADLDSGELDLLLENAKDYIALTDIKPYGNDVYGIALQNVTYYPIDIDYRVNTYAGTDIDQLRIDTQIAMSKELDFRFWAQGSSVQWDNLLQIAKMQTGVKYVPDNNFFPQVDIPIPKNQLPRLRGFIIRDLEGNIIANNSNTLNPIYYTFK